MEFLSAIVSGVVTEVGKYAVAPVGRQVGYVIQYKSNLQNLRTQVNNLKERRQRTNDVNWMTQQVDELTGEVDTFLVDEGHAKSKCFHGFCPNPILYYQLSKKATKLMHKIKLHEETEFPPQEICSVPSQDYLAFGSRISVVKEIMDELSNPNTNKIGVYGVGGVGKTTLAKEVYRQANEKKLFDGVVIVVDVKNYPERIQKENYIDRIQKEIAEKLKIDIRECLTEKGRARHLWDKLKDRKILVILDDVWEKIELEDVGIPPTCNILFTSRNREVLFSQMDTQKEFSLDVLDEEESWRLFEKMAGAVVKDKRIRELATHVFNRCGGLPILIVAVASALRNGTLDQWKDALRRLKKLDMKESEEKALLTLEWSYNQLDAEDLKPLFLLCGIIAWLYNSINLSDCFKYSMGMGLLKNVDTMEESQAAFNSLIKKLQNYCLLLELQDSNDYTFGRMHELVRNVAIRIARRDQHVHIRASPEEELKEWPNKDFLKKCTMILVDQSNIPKLSEVSWECRELNLLLFDSRDDSVSIPSNFFEEMKEIKVLDLTRVHIPSLPSSLIYLTNLQTLCLDQCVFEGISLVGQLRNLKILSLLKSKIKQLPKEIGQLASLRMLDLTGCSELVLISPNVIARLKNLEDLRMGGNSFRQWDAEGVRNASLIELQQLFKLTALDIHIPNANILPCNLFSELERFHIFIGEAWQWSPFDNSFNTLKLKLDTCSQLDRGLEMLLKRSEHLYLDVTEGVNNISHLFNRSQQLKHVEVQNNAEITQVFNYNAFQNLQSLKLWNLPKLVSFSTEDGTAVVTTRTDKQLKIDGKSKEIILENEIGSPVQLLKRSEILMHNLTTLMVHQCDGLRFLLSFSMARSLVQLKHLEIRSCQIMEEIVSTKESGEENTENVFCRLTHLELQHLPKLTRFCDEDFIKFSSLEILHLEDCTELQTFISDPPMISDNITICKDNDKSDLKDNLETARQYFLFNEKVGFPSLESLIIYDLPKLMTIWRDQLAQDSFCRLKKLDVQRCHHLINIFAASIMGRLNALDTLQIENCKSLQVLFELDGINSEKTDESSGTQLRIVECCQNLDLVKIILCERLKNIFPASVVKSLHNLRMLHVELCNGVEAIVGKEECPQTTIPKFMFPKVTSVKFKNLSQLMSFYPGMHSSKWSLLKQLAMVGCHKVGIFASEFLRFQEKVVSTSGSKQPFFLIEKGSLLNLENLFLGDSELEIWDGPLPEELSAVWPSKLKKFWCVSNSSIAFLEKLPNLEQLDVGYVPLKEIFVNEVNSSSVGSQQLLHLKYLSLFKMTELVHIGKDNSPPPPVIPNLEILDVEECVRLRNLTSPAIAFQNLTTLKVIGCHGLEFLTTYSIAQSLTQLKHMKIKDCRGLIQILKNSNQDSGSIEIAFLRLQHLELSGLPSLQRFCSENCIVKLPSLETLTVDNADITYVINHNAFQKLQSLTLMNLPKPVIFSTRTDKQLKIDGESREIILKNEIATPVQLFKNGEIVMSNLTSLIVHQFNGLRFLLSSSMARSLVQLKHLEIRRCQIMEEIVSTKESSEENTENVFCKLTHLELQHLPKLTRFCSGNLIKFPSLEILHLEGCTELRTFISDPPVISDSIAICKDNDKSDLKDNLETAGQYFLFNEKIAFPSLESLIIYDLPKLMTIWRDQLAQDSFCRLKKLDVQRCHHLINIFAASIMGRLNALDTLQIENCKSLQVLFELDRINAEKTDESSGTQLRIVECCQNLDLVKIISCERLKNIFPASMVKSLHNLRMLHVEFCNCVEAIVGQEEGPQTTIRKFMFRKATYVKFINLPELMSFYPGMHSSKWPLLKELTMIGCHKVGIFASEFLRFQEKVASTSRSKQPLFLIEKGSLLNLENLFLGDSELEVWDGPLPEELSAVWPCKLKKFWCVSNSSVAFLEKLPNLEQLDVAHVPLKEIFVNEVNSSSVASQQLLHLKYLSLFKMTELVHIGKDNSQPVIPNLEILWVMHCVRLRNLTSPAIAFQNLTTLKVIGCHILEFLTTYSIAQSLMQLKSMEVKDCRGLIQILKNSIQDSGSIEIAFLRLQHLELSGLPSLQSFCFENCIVKLPSLDTLTFSNCLIELKLSPEKVLLSNSRPERIKLIEEEGIDHDKPLHSFSLQEGSGKT